MVIEPILTMMPQSYDIISTHYTFVAIVVSTRLFVASGLCAEQYCWRSRRLHFFIDRAAAEAFDQLICVSTVLRISDGRAELPIDGQHH